jgi:hypothetical protein
VVKGEYAVSEDGMKLLAVLDLEDANRRHPSP